VDELFGIGGGVLGKNISRVGSSYSACIYFIIYHAASAQKEIICHFSN
jgi:hypothetical protein